MIDFERGFLDTAVFIYHLENNQRYAPITTTILKYADINKKVLTTSVVSVSEFLIKPYAKHDHKAIEQFNLFLFEFPILTFPIDYRIADRAAQLRARYAFLKGFGFSSTCSRDRRKMRCVHHQRQEIESGQRDANCFAQ